MERHRRDRSFVDESSANPATKALSEEVFSERK
jgi:hypothetical protein